MHLFFPRVPRTGRRTSLVEPQRSWARRGSALARVLIMIVGICFLVFKGFAHGPDALAIKSPLANERFVTNEIVNLKVSMKDRHVDASQITWTSNVSGVLGHGSELQVGKLAPGNHTISASIGGETQSISIRVFKDLWDLYQATPSQAELDRIGKDFSLNWVDGSQPDERWAAYDPPTFNQTSLRPSKVVALIRLDMLRHQAFSEPLPFGDGLTVYDHLRKYVKKLNLSLDCADNSGGGGTINLRRWQNSWDLARRDCKSPEPSDPRLVGYVGPLYLLMHEARHSEPGESGHTTCYGFGNMDPSLDKGSGHAQAILYAMWIYKYGLYDPPLMKQNARMNAYSLLSRLCSKPTSSNPKVQAILDELLGEQPAKSTTVSSPMPAPTLLSPADGATLNDPLRHTILSWSAVPLATVYVVEWDYKSGKDWWSESHTRLPEQAKGWWAESRKLSPAEFHTTETKYTFNFVGAQPGRWRVWAVDAEGNAGIKSEWREFRYER
jgi:hypothetical protein